MTWKQKILEAWKRQQARYENYEVGDRFLVASTCELCLIIPLLENCFLCPLYMPVDRGMFCRDFNSYKHIAAAMLNQGSAKKLKRITYAIKKAFAARVKFYKEGYEILKALPDRRFTPSGFRGFPELNRED